MQTWAHKDMLTDEVEILPSFLKLLGASIIGALAGIALVMMMFGFAYRAEFASAVNQLMRFEKIENNGVTPVAEKQPVTLNQEDYLNAFVWTTRVHLQDLRLGNSLKVSTTPDGEILIRGTLLPGHAGRYDMFRAWFQSREAYPPLVDAVSFVKLSDHFPKIRSVWLGENPVLHLDNGKDATVGSTMGDGWIIVEIGRLAMKLERDGAVIELIYEDS